MTASVVAMLEHLAQREPVAAAEDQDLVRRRLGRLERRMDERLVIAILVGRRELQVAVQEQLEPGAPASHDDPLIRRGLGEHDRVRVHLVLGPGREVVGHRDADGEPEQHDHRAGPHADHALADLIASSSQVPHSATPAFKQPIASELRTSPSFGTSTSGNISDAASAPM